MLDLAQVKNVPVVEAVPDPSPVTGFGFLGVNTRNCLVFPAALDTDHFENHPESPLNSVRFYNFICLAGIGGVKCGGGEPLRAFHTAMPATQTTLKLFFNFLLNRPLARAQVTESKAIQNRFNTMHESTSNTLERLSAGDTLEGDDVP